MSSSQTGTKSELGKTAGLAAASVSTACLHRNRGMRWMGLALIAMAAISVLPAITHGGASLLAPVAEAQSFSQRTIQGKVLDDTDTPVQGATVFLKNNKTRSVKSFTSTSNGGFRFAQVGMVDDYDVWAEHANHKSPVKTVSSFNSTKLVEFDLKLK